MCNILDLRQPSLIWLHILITDLYLSDAWWLSVDLRTDTKMECVTQTLDYVIKILNQVKLNSHILEGELLWSFKKKENMHFDNEKDIHTSSKQLWWKRL